MTKRILKTLFFGVAMTTVVAVSAMFAGCTIETKHPEVKISVEFNSNTYELEYKMYRNMYPQTVKHFIELADAGFYNDTVIHNYTSSDMFAGGYVYDADDYAEAIKDNYIGDYLGKDEICLEDKYDELFANNKLTASVYRTVDLSMPLKTVMGEFYKNINQEIEKGSLTAKYGTLKMFYYEKKSTQQVYVTPTSDQTITANYKYNCATSLFMMQIGSSSSYSASDYCTFGEIKDSAALDALVEALNDYIEDNYDSDISDFTQSATVRVDNNDDFSNKDITDRGISTTFAVPRSAIVIKSVTVTKY